MIYLRLILAPICSDLQKPPERVTAEFMFSSGDGWQAARAAGDIARGLGWRPVAITDVYEGFVIEGHSESQRLQPLLTEARLREKAFVLRRIEGACIAASATLVRDPLLRSA